MNFLPNAIPRLRNVIAPGFDYAGFCDAIDRDGILKPQWCAYGKKVYAPDRALLHWVRAPADVEQPLRLDALPCEHPIYGMWNEAWQNVRTRYASEFAAYPQIMTERYAALLPQLSSAKIARLVHSPTVYPNSPVTLHAMRGGKSLSRAVKESALDEKGLCQHADVYVWAPLVKGPEPELRAALHHEARHLAKPVVDGMLFHEAIAQEEEDALHPRNGNLRREEYEADAFTVESGHGPAMRRLLIAVSQTPQQYLRQRAMDHGFAIDVGWPGASHQLNRAFDYAAIPSALKPALPWQRLAAIREQHPLDQDRLAHMRAVEARMR